MSNKKMSNKKTNLSNNRSVQKMARAYNLPNCLVTPEGANLLPLYLQIESLSIKKGYCFAGDQALADNLSYKGRSINKSTVVRQRNKLEAFGVVIREGKAHTRKLWPWWQWVAANSSKSLEEVERLLEKLMPAPPSQGKLFTDDEEIAGGWRTEVVPAPAQLEQAIIAKYGVRSFFDLKEQQQAELRSSWRLENFADLCFLFNQVTITPQGYNHYRRLKPGQRMQIEQHAAFYAYGNRDGEQFMADLADYLNPYKPGYLKKIRDIASHKINRDKTGSTGFNAEQAAFLANLSQGKNLKLK